MPVDFEKNFGVNAGYVEALFERWQAQPDEVDSSWATYFERVAPRVEPAAPERAQAPHAGRAEAPPARTEAAPAPRQKVDGRAAAPAVATPPAQAPPAQAPSPQVPPPQVPPEGDFVVEPLRGLARSIAVNMQASLEVPTATTVRTLPVKVLEENRRLLNAHMKVRALGKASYTHLVAYALVRALREEPEVQAHYAERDGRGTKLTPRRVNLGLAIDVDSPAGRVLVVPCIHGAEALDFKGFVAAYDDVVRRGRDGKLEAADFQGTTASLTNPGGFGTQMSVPRLMQGQGVIVATGSIGVPVEAQSMAPEMLARLALGPVMTVTSTYDHRVVQGAQSALLLKRLEELLNGADGFYDEIFRAMRVPWTPATGAADLGNRERDPGDAQAKVWALIHAYRVRGCQLADLDPLEYTPDPLPSLDPATYGFTLWDLDREFQVRDLAGQTRMTLREALDVLRETYCRRWTIEYMHIVDIDRKHWLRDRVEPRRNEAVFDDADRKRILRLLHHAQNLEQFLHKRYVGNKRFSLEGAESLIPALAELIERAAANGVDKVVLGMAHRGRLNVLTNILKKSYAQVFREFEGVVLPLSTEGSGDVKYHLGQRGKYPVRRGELERDVDIVLAPNPSHLEAVDPVVCGMARGYQDELGDGDRRRVLGVLLHGDAAFSGQGVVAETLNMSALPAFRTGGTIHIVINNQIGFTAGPRDLQSTYYCTDIAKSIQAPILHANGDNPEAVLKAVHVAVDYQRTWGGDVVVDLVCYRRWGHNEGDEPAFTQPVLYRKIHGHPTVAENYRGLLVRSGAMTAEQCAEVSAEVDEELRAAVAELEAQPPPAELPLDELLDLDDDDPSDYQDAEAPETGVPAERLAALVDRLNTLPEGHVAHPNLLRQLTRREKMVRGEQGLDWGCAEAVAFGTILQDGTPIRLCGQDSARGTFSHRHAVIRDQQTAADYVPLADIGPEAAPFEAHDSLLSEEAALGFEWGYANARPRALALWEAQFGDFVNGAQTQIDQFVVASEAKWRELSGVVLLLPHGYDGQGPEHSSARLERFLAQASHGNITVANCTTSAQYFHLLRRHAALRPRRPLVVMTPKSLLRDHRAASPIEAFASGAFRPVLSDETVEAAERAILCSGKVYYDLADFRAAGELANVALVRLEQLYPFPRKALAAELARLGAKKLVWCQEEPRNMGAWTFVRERQEHLPAPLSYAGRPSSSSPATGSYKRHNAEQEHLIRRAFEA